MTKFQIASDLHIETCTDIPQSSTYIIPKTDMLILAGDIGRLHDRTRLETFLTDLSSKFKIIFYVLGNHEYYKMKNNTTHLTIDELNIVAKEIQDKINNNEELGDLYILNNQSDGFIIDDVLITGCTLWSQSTVNIPSFIVRVHGMTTKKYNNLHMNDRAYLHNMVQYASDNKLKLLVVTHHTPSYTLLPKKYRKDRFKSLYASNLDHLLYKQKVHTWICGHVHSNFDFNHQNGTRIVSNQCGKPRDNIQDYNKEKVINI